MVHWRDVHSSSPVRTSKLQLTAEQPSTGECWIPSKKDISHPSAKEKPQQDDTDTVLPSVCQQVELSASWKNLQWPQDLIMSVIIPIPMKGNAEECSY